jgi:ATP-binding cassette subfamily B protein
LRKALAQLPYLPQTLSLVWAAARGWTVTWGVLLLLQGLLPVATVYVTQEHREGFDQRRSSRPIRPQ